MDFYLIYILVITILLIANYFSARTSKVFEPLAYVVITIISGLRYRTGYDYDTYDWIYSGVIDDASIEVGFRFLMNIFRFFELDVTFLFFTMALLTYFFLYLGVKKATKHTGIALIVFMLIPGLYLNTLSIIRQELAIVIAFYAFSALTERRFYKYFALMLLGISFHYTCILILFAQLFVWKINDKVKIWHYYLLLAFSLIILKTNGLNFLLNYLAGLKYESYVEGESVSFIKALVLNVFIITQLFFYQRFVKKNSFNKYAISFSVLAIVIINCFSSLVIITRIAYYFRIFEIVLIAEFVYLFANQNLRLIVLALVYTYYMAMFVFALQGDIAADGFGQSKMIPYQNILFNYF